MCDRISVIIPTYNRAAMIGRAIRSALMQCETGDEIIVVDDGSTDSTRDIVSNFGSQVHYVYVPNGGAGRARNIGVDHARNPLVAFLDSDDEWMDGKLKMQRSLMQARTDLLFSFSNFAITLKEGNPVHFYLRNWLTTAPMEWHEAIGPPAPFSSIAPLPSDCTDMQVYIGDMSAAEMVDNYILTSSLVVRRKEAGDALRFAEDLAIYEDWYCFARLSLHGLAAYLDCETTWQHGEADTRVSDAGTLLRAQSWQTLNERIWAQVPGFCDRNAELYNLTTLKKRLALARGLIGCGRTREARNVLSDLPEAPLYYRLLSRLPGPLVRCALGAWRGWLT